MVFFSLSATVLGQGLTASLDQSGSTFLWIALLAGLLGLVFALFLARSVLAFDTGTAEMRLISNAIREGAEAFMSRQYTTIAALAVVLAIALFVGYKCSDFTAPLAGKVVISFLIGAICSGFAGYTGMFVSIRTNIRAASAARTSLGKALKISLHGGAVTGMVVISLSLLGVGSLFFLFGGLKDPQHVPYQLVGFGFGASLVALFAQLGGGIYTKAADVGADLVGKVEAGIPEDDPRNPAVIADLVGDNVGDCAGRGADIFESTAAENVGAMILGTALYPVFGVKGILFPLIVHAINLVASFVGVLVVHSREDQDPMDALNRGYYVTTLLAVGLRSCRHGDVFSLCPHHGVLHRDPLPAGAIDRQRVADRPRNQYHQRPRGGHGDAGHAGGGDQRCPAAQLLLWRAWTRRCDDLRIRQGHLRHRYCHHGHALVCRLHPGHGYLWADY
jgi:K(+)-stimulated pyrophosphate-energized sodium pump